MMLVLAAVSGAAALVAGFLGFTGVVRGVAGAAKALFFGFLAFAGVCAALGLFAAKKLGG